MNKDIIEDYLIESLSQLELARDHAAGYDQPEVYNRLKNLCQNVSDLLDQFEDGHVAINSKPRYSSAEATLLYRVLQNHSAESLQSGLDSESRATLNDALANLRMELLDCAAQGQGGYESDLSEDSYRFDDPVDGQ